MQPFLNENGITIYHGDCRNVLPLIEPESVTLLWTDPPYGHSNLNGHDLQSKIGEATGGIRTLRSAGLEPIANDDPDTMRETVDAALALSVPLLRPDCCCCCCCGGGGPQPTFAWVAQRLDEQGLSFFHSVIWDKLNPGLGWRYRRQHEMVMVAHRAGGKLAWAEGQEAVSNVIVMPAPSGALRDHPNEKPVGLVERFIRQHTEPGDLVLDPFMGGGTTLRAAANLGRRAIGIELDERYCEIAARRLAQLSLA